MPDADSIDYLERKLRRDIESGEIRALLGKYEHLSGVLSEFVRNYSVQRDRWHLLKPEDLRSKNVNFLTKMEDAADVLRLARKRYDGSANLSDADRGFFLASLQLGKRELAAYDGILRHLQPQPDKTLEPPGYWLAVFHDKGLNQRPDAIGRMHGYQV